MGLSTVGTVAIRILATRGPNNLLLTPDLKPFAAVTYLPKEEWVAMLNKTVDLWEHDRNQLDTQAESVCNAMKQFFSGGPPIHVSLPVDSLAQDYYATLAASLAS